ncbi:hypothetical protein ACJJTC_004431, partial [Scirpophaga incertulas]
DHILEEGEVQRVIAGIEAWKSIVQTAIPTLLVIFLGAWSDRTGNRKVCIILPICGELLVTISNIISVYFFNEISVEVTMFFEAFFQAISGGWVYDIFSCGGYYGIFAATGTIYIITIIYACLCLDSKTKQPVENKDKKKSVSLTDLVHMVKETVHVAFKKRENNSRAKIIMTLIVVGIIYGPNHGERIVFYMFVRYRLGWDAIKYSMYSTYNIITHSLGALFSISVFSKKLGYHDSVLCLISIISKLIGSVYIAFVYTDLQMFMVPIIEILNATTFTSLRSMASKLVPSEELGKMNSLFSLIETMGAMIFDPSYSAMYSKTVKVFSGTVFIYSALLTLPPIAILIWLFSQHRRETKERRAVNIIDEPCE